MEKIIAWALGQRLSYPPRFVHFFGGGSDRCKWLWGKALRGPKSKIALGSGFQISNKPIRHGDILPLVGEGIFYVDGTLYTERGRPTGLAE